jgi:hypothetical protein
MAYRPRLSSGEGAAVMKNDPDIITEADLSELVFVPTGDGEEAKRKPLNDLFPEEYTRYLAGLKEKRDRFNARLDRSKALRDMARQRILAGQGKTLGDVLTEAEVAELTALTKAINGTMAAIDRHEAARQRDIAAGRYFRRRGDRG